MSSHELEPFEYDEEQAPRKRKPLSKNKHLYGDDWEESDDE